MTKEFLEKIKKIKEGDIITKVIEEGHCIISYQLKVTEIEEESKDYFKFYGRPVTEEDKEYAEDFGYYCYCEDLWVD